MSRRTFSFVDRIACVEPGARVRGTLTIPANGTEFPPSLVVEAVGQLAAWSAMAKLDFRKRPVAGIAGAVEFLNPVFPGQVLDLAADIESVDEEAVAYAGTASCDGNPIVRLENCVGPMISIEAFDDPASLRERYQALCSAHGASNGFEGVPSIRPTPIGGEPGRSIIGQIQVPDSAPFFADHFPRRPVFPGTLLMHANLLLVYFLLEKMPGPGNGLKWEPRTVADVKLRTFIPPGELLESEAKLIDGPPDAPIIALENRKGKRTIGTARVKLSAVPS